MKASAWPIFRCTESGEPVAPHDGIDAIPTPPPWRLPGSPLDPEPKPELSDIPPLPHVFEKDEIELINAAMFVRRPLLVTGPPGCGKSAFAKTIAWQLKLGQLLRWPINTRSTLREGLYAYDAVARLQDINIQGTGSPAVQSNIGEYLRLGPLGTALLPRRRPRVLLIDEIDKSDPDLPNDLLDVFEEGSFEIPELVRLAKRNEVIDIRPSDNGEPWPIKGGRIKCCAFPIVIMTSNGERSFSPAFLRRCVRMDISSPSAAKLERIVQSHLGRSAPELLAEFLERRSKGHLATDQLLNAVYLLTSNHELRHDMIKTAVFRDLE